LLIGVITVGVPVASPLMNWWTTDFVPDWTLNDGTLNPFMIELGGIILWMPLLIILLFLIVITIALIVLYYCLLYRCYR